MFEQPFPDFLVAGDADGDGVPPAVCRTALEHVFGHDISTSIEHTQALSLCLFRSVVH